METQNVLDFWAKKSEDNEDRYPLLCHMLDTVAVCREMWVKCLQESAKRFIASELKLTDADVLKWISFWVGLHDIGKATPDFQGNSEIVKLKLTQAGFPFEPHRTETYHGTATACILAELCQGVIGQDMAKKISVAVGGHHGVFPRSTDIRKRDRI